MKPSDIARTVSVSSPVVSPDGSRVAYVVRRVDSDANTYRSAVWVADADGSDPRQLTAGSEGDSSPTWSPSGDRLAFTSSRGKDDDRKVTLHVIPVDRPGETVTLFSSQEGVGGVAWSPDGRRLAYTARTRDKRYSEGKDDRSQPPRKIDQLFFTLDSEGWTIDRPYQLYVVPVDGSAVPRRVTKDRYNWGAPTWAPDSRRIAASAGRHEKFDLEPFSDVWVIDVDDVDWTADPDDAGAVPEPRKVTATDANYDLLSWEPDGERIACIWAIEDIGYRHGRVAVVDAGSGEATILTRDLDRTAAPYPGARPPVWVGDRLVFMTEDHGAHTVRSVPAAGGDIETLVADAGVIGGYDVSADGTTVAFTASRDGRPSELYVRRGNQEQVTRHQDAFVAACPPLVPQHVPFTSPSGMELDAWVVLPPDFDPQGSYPALLNIHGGPHTQYTSGWFDEFQLYASAGYVVVYSNPRGSTSYDEASARVLISGASKVDPGEGWGPPAMDDVMAAMDAAVAAYPAIDEKRLGVMGGSYGGYMTSWIVGHSQRFAAACSERAVNNIASLEWASDAMGFFRFAMGATHLEAPEEYARLSPITYVRDIRTPLLILHSDQDLRCPHEQADQLYLAMRLLDKPVDYYRFPAESHELTRGGSPTHRTQRAELILEWFGERLKP